MKLIFTLLLISQVSFAAPPTSDQILLVSTTSVAIISTANQLYTLATQLYPIAVSNYAYSTYFTTNTVNLTTIQKNDIANYYSKLKTALQVQINSLP